MKKHGYDRDGFPICHGDKVKFIGGCTNLNGRGWDDFVGGAFTVWGIEPEGYDGRLGIRIHGKGESGWTNTWNLLRVVEE